jgi:hypothetical protein
VEKEGDPLHQVFVVLSRNNERFFEEGLCIILTRTGIKVMLARVTLENKNRTAIKVFSTEKTTDIKVLYIKTREIMGLW